MNKYEIEPRISGTFCAAWYSANDEGQRYFPGTGESCEFTTEEKARSWLLRIKEEHADREKARHRNTEWRKANPIIEV